MKELENIMKQFELSDNPVKGQSIILPNGKFVDLYKKGYTFDKLVGVELKPTSIVNSELLFLYEQNCICVNDGTDSYFPYVKFRYNAPTPMQLQALEKWADYYHNNHKGYLSVFIDQTDNFINGPFLKVYRCNNKSWLTKIKKYYGWLACWYLITGEDDGEESFSFLNKRYKHPKNRILKNDDNITLIFANVKDVTDKEINRICKVFYIKNTPKIVFEKY